MIIGNCNIFINMRKIRFIISVLAMSLLICSCSTKTVISSKPYLQTIGQTKKIKETTLLSEKITKAPQGAIFYDPFDSGTKTPWTFYQGTHQFVNGVLKLNCATNAGEYSYVRTNWTNISVQSDVKLYPNSFGAGIGTRYNATNGASYSAWLYPSNNMFTIEKYSKWYNKTIVAVTNVANVNTTNIHNLKLSVTNNTIIANLDNTYVIKYTDVSSPLVSGGIDLSIWGGTTADFDNVTVYNLDIPSTTNTPPKVQSITTRVISTQGNNFVISAIVGGTSPSYQWYFGGGTNGIVGATNSLYTVTNTQTRNAGLYKLIVTNALGSVSSMANVSVFTTNILPQCVSTFAGVSSVTLAWCPSLSWTPVPNIGITGGYRIYYGSGLTTNWIPTIYDTNYPPCPPVVLSIGTNWLRSYTNIVDVGNATNATITNLIMGVPYYFSATAYDTNGLESDFSEEITKIIPFPPAPIITNATLNIYWLSSLGCPAIQTKVCPFQSVTYQYKTNLIQNGWMILTNIIADQYGNSVYDDVGAIGTPSRFYRISTP